MAGSVPRIFSTKPFGRFATREGIDDDALREAIVRAEAGQIDADLGGGVIKQRIARKGGGRSGGFRTIILFRRETLAIFVYGFGKKARDNIRSDELKAFRRLAAVMLQLDEAGQKAAMSNGTLKEIGRHG